MVRLLLVLVVAACSHPAARPAPVTDEPPPGGTATATATSTSISTSSTPDTTTTTTTTTTSSTTNAGSAAASPPGPPVLASCPATYAEAAAGTCALASVDKLSCPYADGHCGCITYRPCAGIASVYDEAREHPSAAWSCTPKLRPDGCLGDEPAVGSLCTKDAQECAYGSCGGQVLACRTGKWAVARMISPPPAAHR
ncbi:MAG: hypothetical protein ABI467_21870 [Kofleriaceae bacterium]